MSEEDLVSWSPESMLEITLAQPDDFLKVRETLSRVGVASRKDKILYQSCHILHKQGKYYIVHFKELFALDGKDSTITQNDIERRNTIAGLLQDWSLLAIVKNEEAEKKAPLSQIKVLAFKEKSEWDLQAKYNIGKKPEEDNESVKKPEENNESESQEVPEIVEEKPEQKPEEEPKEE
jgi:hypothetical protein|tara:strand:- start:1567 stop:2100 length:534 start_codon:yes stop_codon:yes gene_type:complete